jgi:hypothetical protein
MWWPRRIIAVLKRIAAPEFVRLVSLSKPRGKTEHNYGEVEFAARKWPYPRRVVIKSRGRAGTGYVCGLRVATVRGPGFRPCVSGCSSSGFGQWSRCGVRSFTCPRHFRFCLPSV